MKDQEYEPEYTDMDDRNLLDEKTFGNLFELSPNDSEVVRTLIGMFSVQSEKLLGELTQANEMGDQASLKGLIHNLKGVSLNMGAKEMSSACRELESKLSSITKEDLTQKLRQLIALRDVTLRAMEAFKPT